MKKLLSLLLVLALAMSLAACSGNDNNSNADTDAPDTAAAEDAGDESEAGTEEADTAGDADAGAPADAEVIRIGGMGPLTGTAASYGISVKQGAELAINEINEAGGITVGETTYVFELDFQDDEASEDKAVSAYNTLADGGMDLFLGTVTSSACLAVTDLSLADQILQITPSGSAEAITQNENVYRLCFQDPFQGESMANYITEELGLSKVAVIYNNGDEYSYGIKDAFAEYFTGEIVAEEAFAENDVDFKTQLTSIKNTDAEIIFVPAYYQEASYITQQAAELEMDLPFVGSDGWDGVLATVTDADAVEGAVFMSPFVASLEEVADFVNAYDAAYSATPDQFAADGYDTVYVFKAALEEAGSLEYAELLTAMQNITVDGLTGTMSFDENGEPEKDIKFVVIENGEYKALH